jgi:hypothetical protein
MPSCIAPADPRFGRPNRSEGVAKSRGRTLFVVDAHRRDGKRFVVHAEEKLTTFVELESATRNSALLDSHCLGSNRDYLDRAEKPNWVAKNQFLYAAYLNGKENER